MRTLILLLTCAVPVFGQVELSLLAIKPAAAGGPPTPDLLWAKFPNGSGATATSDVGPNFNASGTWVTGKSGSGYSIDFDGVASDLDTASAITPSAQIVTIAAWFYFDATNSTRILWELSDTINSNDDAFAAYIVDGEIFFREKNSTSRTEKIQAPNTGAWNHFLVVYDMSTASGDVKVYLNGSSQSTTVVDSTTAGASNFASYVLYMGERGSSTSLNLDGKIDDVRLWTGDRSSSASDIYNDTAY